MLRTIEQASLPKQVRCDVVLLFGPLYHLTQRVDRLTALQEARRVLRSGGLLLAAGISRFASALDGLR
jgi:SAM-dependent methyltransferase